MLPLVALRPGPTGLNPWLAEAHRQLLKRCESGDDGAVKELEKTVEQLRRQNTKLVAQRDVLQDELKAVEDDLDDTMEELNVLNKELEALRERDQKLLTDAGQQTQNPGTGIP
tara:strand:+ start:96 stop:434 length:339 start_codon:yes stop_codon:yes gene_type:complete